MAVWRFSGRENRPCTCRLKSWRSTRQQEKSKFIDRSRTTVSRRRCHRLSLTVLRLFRGNFGVSSTVSDCHHCLCTRLSTVDENVAANRRNVAACFGTINRAFTFQIELRRACTPKHANFLSGSNPHCLSCAACLLSRSATTCMSRFQRLHAVVRSQAKRLLISTQSKRLARIHTR